MLSGLYSAATAMDAAATQHEVVARNLANAHVPGFRRGVVVSSTFETALNAAQQNGVLHEAWGVSDPRVVTDFAHGPLQQTGRSLDFAIDGDAFFVVEGPAGLLYTRNGAFQVNAGGTLVTSDGLPVQGEGGPLTIPPDVPASALAVSRNGTLVAGGNAIGRLQLVRFEDPTQLTPAGASLFAAGGAVSEPSDAGVLQGLREQSNVSAVEELIHMIVGLRHFEAAQRALRSIDEAIQQHTNPQLT